MLLNKNKVHSLFEKIVDKFLKVHISESNTTVEKMKRLVRIDEDTLIISPQEITDFINFNIYMERDRSHSESVGSKEYKLSSLSEFMENKVEEEVFENHETEYSIDQVKESVMNLLRSLSCDFFEKNENIIATFK